MRPVIDAAAALHAKGFVHRDIKPGNIFVRADGSLVLGDVGTTLHEEDDRLTLPHQEIFSRTWVPDWVISRRQAAWTPRTDVFMLCRTMYFMLFGGKPQASQLADPEFDPHRQLENTPGGALVADLLVRHLVTRESDVESEGAEELRDAVDEILPILRGEVAPQLLASVVATHRDTNISGPESIVPLDVPLRTRALLVEVRGCGAAPAILTFSHETGSIEAELRLPTGTGFPGIWSSHVVALGKLRGRGRLTMSLMAPPKTTVSAVLVRQGFGRGLRRATDS